jgi:hypothetical protein
MIKHTISILVKDEFDKALVRRISNVDGAYSTLFEFINTNLRNRIKYQELSEEVTKEIEELRSELLQLMEDNNVDLDNDYL